MYLDYAGIRVTNLKKVTEFVTQGLGLEELRRGKEGHGGVWVLFHDRRSHQQLELNWYPKGSKFATPFLAGEGLDHLGFRVSDMKAAVRRVKSAGGRPVHEVKWKGKVVLSYFEGPDGLWIELILSPDL